MLKSWSIENFKPIVNSGELRLAPVTVLAGRNSSGKSSLLQSILMISQTLSSRVLDRSLLPNGPIIQLGTFEDILNEASKSRVQTVCFELGIDREDPRSLPLAARRTVGSIFIDERLSVKSAKVTAKFSSAHGNGTSSSAVEASTVEVENVFLEIGFELRVPQAASQLGSYIPEQLSLEEHVFSLSIKKILRDDLKQFLANVSPDNLRSMPYLNEQSTYLGEIEANESGGDGPYLVTLSHFLPARLFKKFKVEERRKQRLERRIANLFEYSPESIPRIINLSNNRAENIYVDELIPEGLLSSLEKICKDNNISRDFSGQSIRELVQWFRSLGIRGDKRKAISKSLQDMIVQYLLQKEESENFKNSEGLEVATNNIYVGNLDQAVEQITRFFTSKIRYLGPLRADPQASQKFAPSSELDDIGAKGEYAAAVYDANQNARIDWYNPFKGQVERGTLKEALDSWTRYLGVANQIKIEMAGQSGVSWQVVHLKGHKALPLSAVGVGVSQILPILVMGLLAPANTLLIVEQPELHLHPRVQARLGDFFMGLAKCKKQCLIETHSENLVSQLRYHIVQAGGMDKSDCLIYFVDQDEKGAARFEPVQISPQGNILNWPDGFFDETMQQEDRITAASIRKRAKLAKNG
jgi:predicted ATPase